MHALIFSLILMSFPVLAESFFTPGKNPLFLTDEDVRRDVNAFCDKSTPAPKEKNLFSEKALKYFVAQEQNRFPSLRCLDELMAKLRTLDPVDCGTKRNCLQAKEAIATYLASMSQSREKKKTYFADRIVQQYYYGQKSTPAEFEQAMNSPVDECNSWKIIEEQSLLEANMAKMKKFPRTCLNSILSSTAYQFVSYREWLKNYESECKEFPVDKCAEHARYLQSYRNNIRDLTALVGKSYHLSDDEIACLPSVDTESPSALIDILNKAKAALLCEALTPGKAHVVDSSEGSPTGVSPRYMIKKEEDGSYTVNLRMKMSGTGVDLPALEKRIRDCYKEIEPFMKGPNGESMRLHLLSAEELEALPQDQRPPPNPVSVTSEDVRANSQYYPVNAACSTIVHEGLHLTGLVDEYDGTTDGYTCRATPKASSIMSNSYSHYPNSEDKVKDCVCAEENHCQGIFKGDDENLKKFYVRMYGGMYLADSFEKYCDTDYDKPIEMTLEQIQAMSATLPLLNETEKSVSFFGYYFLTKQNTFKVYPHTCNCGEGEDCQKQIATFKEEFNKVYQGKSNLTCPGESTTRVEKIAQPLTSPWKLDGPQLSIYMPAKEKSLLAPTQFQRIISGNCPTSTPDYDQCAVWAYRAKDASGACPGKPAMCDSDFRYIGIPQ